MSETQTPDSSAQVRVRDDFRDPATLGAFDAGLAVACSETLRNMGLGAIVISTCIAKDMTTYLAPAVALARRRKVLQPEGQWTGCEDCRASTHQYGKSMSWMRYC